MGNLDFLQKMFYNINYWRSFSYVDHSSIRTLRSYSAKLYLDWNAYVTFKRDNFFKPAEHADDT